MNLSSSQQLNSMGRILTGDLVEYGYLGILQAQAGILCIHRWSCGAIMDFQFFEYEFVSVSFRFSIPMERHLEFGRASIRRRNRRRALVLISTPRTIESLRDGSETTKDESKTNPAERLIFVVRWCRFRARYSL